MVTESGSYFGSYKYALRSSTPLYWDMVLLCWNISFSGTRTLPEGMVELLWSHSSQQIPVAPNSLFQEQWEAGSEEEILQKNPRNSQSLGQRFGWSWCCWVHVGLLLGKPNPREGKLGISTMWLYSVLEQWRNYTFMLILFTWLQLCYAVQIMGI